MSNQAEIDYEKQFQDDLAKATALSLEQQALDDYRRSKKYGTASNAYYERAQQESVNSYYKPSRNRQYGRGNSSETVALPLSGPPLQSHRRHSEVSNTTSIAASVATTSASASGVHDRSKTPPPSSLAESDLISFASPTTKEPENSTFDKLIEELQKIQTTNKQTALVPLGRTAAAVGPNYPIYRSAPPSAAVVYATPHQYRTDATAGMQLVPFTPMPQQQRLPLTNEELQKLYNMPHPQTTAYQNHIGFVHPHTTGMGFYAPYPQSAPVVGSAAYVPSQYPTPYGFQYNNNNISSPTTSTSSSYMQQSIQVRTTSAELPTSNNTIASQNSLYPKSTSIIPNGNNTSINSSSTSNLYRQNVSARKHVQRGDLIDLNQDDDSRVSVLEAFDPLLNENTEVRKK